MASLLNGEIMKTIKEQYYSKSNRHQKQIKRIGNYIVGKSIGFGTLGKIKLGKHCITDQFVAIKIIHKGKLTDGGQNDRVIREIEILKVLRHPNLVQLYEIIETPSQILLVLEYVPGGLLFDYVISKGKMWEFDAGKMFWGILNGVEYLHNNKIVHRDLKVENILLDSKLNPKIIDFHFSTFQKNASDQLKTCCGTLEYSAPEILANKKYNGFQTDIWSLGVILYVLCCGYLPFDSDNQSELIKKITSNELEFPEFVSEPCKELIQSLLVSDPNKRPKIPIIRKHNWFKINKVKASIKTNISLDQTIHTLIDDYQPAYYSIGQFFNKTN